MRQVQVDSNLQRIDVIHSLGTKNYRTKVPHTSPGHARQFNGNCILLRVVEN